MYPRKSVSNMYNHKLRNNLYFKHTYNFARLKDKDKGQANTKKEKFQIYASLNWRSLKDS